MRRGGNQGQLMVYQLARRRSQIVAITSRVRRPASRGQMMTSRGLRGHFAAPKKMTHLQHWKWVRLQLRGFAETHIGRTVPLSGSEQSRHSSNQAQRQSERPRPDETRSGEVMARVTKKRKSETAPQTPLETLMHEHLDSLRVRGYSEHTVKNRQVHIGFFIAVGLRARPARANGDHAARARTLSAVLVLLPQEERRAADVSQPARAPGALARVVRWMTRQNHILHNPASEIDLPRLGRTCCPKTSSPCRRSSR